MNATLFAQLTFIIIFFLDLFRQFSPLAPFIKLFKFILFDQLSDPCFKLVFGYCHTITRFQIAGATAWQHQHEGKYANKKTHNKPFVVCCVCRSFTPLLYYKPIYLSIFYWLAVLALSACSVTCLSRLLCERKLFVHVVVNMHEPVVWCRLLPCCRLALRKLPFFHNNVCRVYFYIVPIRVASRLNSSR